MREVLSLQLVADFSFVDYYFAISEIVNRHKGTQKSNQICAKESVRKPSTLSGRLQTNVCVQGKSGGKKHNSGSIIQVYDRI